MQSARNRWRWRLIVAGLASLVMNYVPSRGLAGEDRDGYGPFGLLDHRSSYGQYWFPEPLRADEADVDNEVRMDWFHAENSGYRDDQLRLELEKSVGLFTFEIAPTWESAATSTRISTHRTRSRHRDEDFGNVELGARFPFFQFVSNDRFFDTTFVLGMEAALPTQTRTSRDWELVPKVFNLTRLGEHVSIQAGLGDSILAGPVGHGLSTLEYDLVLGYELTHEHLALPSVLSTTPLVEFDGGRGLNQGFNGHDQLFMTLGFRFNFDSIRWLPAQPRIGVGYMLPIDRGARQNMRWGIVTSLVFEY